MKVYAFVGASGTGKSTSALHVAHQYGIDAIIDDGLLIVQGEKVAGMSAKFEKNTLTAVRRAIFQDDVHQRAVMEALLHYQVQSLLILGTSVKMVNKIATRLHIEEIDVLLYVEDVRTEKEIQMARFVRETQGKHVMPIPYKQVEQNFFKRLIQRGMDIFSSNREKIGETTIVRPDFQHETVDIAKHVYIQIVQFVASTHPAVKKVEHVHVQLQTPLPEVALTVTLQAPITYIIHEEMKALQQQIVAAFAQHFTIEPAKVQLVIKAIES